MFAKRVSRGEIIEQLQQIMSIKQTNNAQQAAWLAISSFSSLALGFVSAAILSRYFDKVEYGTYKQILFVYGTLQSVFTIGLPSVFSYFIPRYSYEEGKYFVNRINRIFLLLGLIFSITLYLSSDLIAQLLKNKELAEGLKIFSIFPIFTLPALGVEGLYTALKKTKYIAIYNTISKLLMLICIVSPVIFLDGNYKTAIIGWGVASFLIFIYAMYMKNRPYFGVKKQPIQNFHSTVFNYSAPLMAASVAGFFIGSSNQFFISRYYGSEAFAEYSNGFIALPFIAMVIKPIKDVLLPLFSKAQKEQNLINALNSYKYATYNSVILIYPIILFCIFFANDFISFVYGSKYYESASYFRVSLIRDFLDTLPYLAILLATGHSKIYFKGHLVFAICLVLFSYLFSKLLFPPIIIVILFVGLEFLMKVFYLYFIYKIEKINLIPFDLIKKIGMILLHITVILIPLHLFSSYLLEDLPIGFRISINFILFYIMIFATQKLTRINYLAPIYQIIKK